MRAVVARPRLLLGLERMVGGTWMMLRGLAAVALASAVISVAAPAQAQETIAGLVGKTVIALVEGPVKSSTTFNGKRTGGTSNCRWEYHLFFSSDRKVFINMPQAVCNGKKHDPNSTQIGHVYSLDGKAKFGQYNDMKLDYGLKLADTSLQIDYKHASAAKGGGHSSSITLSGMFLLKLGKGCNLTFRQKETSLNTSPGSRYETAGDWSMKPVSCKVVDGRK